MEDSTLILELNARLRHQPIINHREEYILLPRPVLTELLSRAGLLDKTILQERRPPALVARAQGRD